MRAAPSLLVPAAAIALLAGCASTPSAPDAPAGAASQAAREQVGEPDTEAGRPPAEPDASEPEQAQVPTTPQQPAEATPAPAPTRTSNGLGLSQQGIIDALAERDLDASAFEVQTLGDGREVMTASFPNTTDRQVLWVAMFGGERPHTVRTDFFPSNARPEEAQAVGAALDRLLVALFPDWPEAPTWPELAGGRAWRETAALGEQDGDNRQIPILETERDGVWLGALGVPPQIVSYVFTTEEVCRPSNENAQFFEGYTACR